MPQRARRHEERPTRKLFVAFRDFSGHAFLSLNLSVINFSVHPGSSPRLHSALCILHFPPFPLLPSVPFWLRPRDVRPWLLFFDNLDKTRLILSPPTLSPVENPRSARGSSWTKLRHFAPRIDFREIMDRSDKSPASPAHPRHALNGSPAPRPSVKLAPVCDSLPSPKHALRTAPHPVKSTA